MPRIAGQIDLTKTEAILEATAEAIFERGLAVSMDEIARRAGVSKQTIYNHYGSKGDLVRALIVEGVATAVHDVSDGGLLVALAEMAMAGDIGAQLLAAPSSTVPYAYWFGEDQARYIVTVPAADAGLVLAKMKGAGVPCARVGTTGGDAIAVAGETPVAITSLTKAFEAWLPNYMNGKAS